METNFHIHPSKQVGKVIKKKGFLETAGTKFF